MDAKIRQKEKNPKKLRALNHNFMKGIRSKKMVSIFPMGLIA